MTASPLDGERLNWMERSLRDFDLIVIRRVDYGEHGSEIHVEVGDDGGPAPYCWAAASSLRGTIDRAIRYPVEAK